MIKEIDEAHLVCAKCYTPSLCKDFGPFASCRLRKKPTTKVGWEHYWKTGRIKRTTKK